MNHIVQSNNTKLMVVLTSFFVAIGIISCNTIATTEGTVSHGSGRSLFPAVENSQGYLTLSVSRRSGTELNSNYAYCASFRDTVANQEISVGAVQVAGFPLTQNSVVSNNNVTHIRYGQFSQISLHPSTPKPVFGAVSNWSIEGNVSKGFPGFSASIYSPQELVMYSPTPNMTTRNVLVKTANLPVSWNSDPSNQNQVIVVINYVPENQTRTNLPTEGKRWHSVVPDNGSYTIPSSVLQQFTTGSIVDIQIFRYNIIDQNVNGVHYAVQVLCEALDTFVLD